MKWLNDSELEKYILQHAKLEPGDKLEGRVIEVRRDTRVLIDFGKFRALAEVHVPVEQGHIIKVVVESRKPKLRLRLEASTDGDPFKSLPGQPVSTDARQVLQSLELIEGGAGDYWGQADLLLRRLMGMDDAGGILFPPVITGMLERGNCVVKTRTHEKELQKISLLVDTIDMSLIRVDIHVILEEKKINITYYVKDLSVQQKIESYLPVVRLKLGTHYKQVVLHVIQSQLKILDFDIEELESIAGTRRVLDVKA